jgi:hypothetical protein
VVGTPEPPDAPEPPGAPEPDRGEVWVRFVPEASEPAADGAGVPLGLTVGNARVLSFADGAAPATGDVDGTGVRSG